MHGNPLFGGDGLPLDCRVIVRPATGGTQAVHSGLDVVVAKLTYLARVLARLGMASPSFGRAAYLVATRTGTEVPVRQVELLDAEGAALLLVIVDKLVLLHSRHGDVCGRGVSSQV